MKLGAWGTAIFSDDDACDVRDSYVERLVIGRSDETAEAETIEEYENPSEIDFPVFWIALAITQWKKGRLSPGTKRKALAAIEIDRNNIDGLWKESEKKKRSKVLDEAKQKLETPMPERKKIRMPAWHLKYPWQAGNVLQYKIASPRPGYEAFRGKYVLLQIIKISETPPDKVPCETMAIGFYDWISDTPPNSNELKGLTYRKFKNPISGIEKKIVGVMFPKEIQVACDIKVISQEPLSTESDFYSDCLYVKNPDGYFDVLICESFATQ